MCNEVLTISLWGETKLGPLGPDSLLVFQFYKIVLFYL
jgi:hypothetical protein